MRNEFADGIITVDQVVRQMGVEALDANTRATNAPRGVSEIVAYRCFTTSKGVLIMRALQFNFVHHRLETVHATFALEATHGLVQLAVHEPIEGWHRGPVTQVGFILNHHGPAIDSSHNHRAASSQGSAEQFFNGGEISG